MKHGSETSVPGPVAASRRMDIEIDAEGGVRLRGWLFRPAARGLRPAITLAHGGAAVKEHGLDRLGAWLAAAGFVVLVHDHRGFGASEGVPRQDADPWRQVADWRRVISWLEAQPGVDAHRIGVWGSGDAGGHAIVLGATDRRLRAIVAQAPLISGRHARRRTPSPDDALALELALAEDERAQFRGEPPARRAIVSARPDIAAAHHSTQAIDFYLRRLPPGAWDNHVTLRSARAAQLYEPGAWIEQVTPAALMMIVADEDAVHPPELARAAFAQANEPKRLVTLPGGHFDMHGSQFERAAEAALDWFRAHLGG